MIGKRNSRSNGGFLYDLWNCSTIDEHTSLVQEPDSLTGEIHLLAYDIANDLTISS